jgi:predicted nucleic acid-binding protein
MRLVIDTDVVVAGMRSPSGASAALLVMLLQRKARMLMSVAMVLEYEAVCMMAEHRLASHISETQVRLLIDSLIDVAEPVEVHYQSAVNGRADAIVTFNRRDYGQAPNLFGIKVLSPGEALRSIMQ